MMTSALTKKSGSKPALKSGRARVQVETIQIDKALPKISMKQLEMMAKIDADKKTKPPIVLNRMHEEACSRCEPPSSMIDKNKLPVDWRHMPWDEVELKKHSLIDRNCLHLTNAEHPDEVEMKKLGLVDSKGRHRKARQIVDEKTKLKAVEAELKTRQQIENLSKNGGGQQPEKKKKESRIKIDRNVEIVDDTWTPAEPSSSAIILTAHPSSRTNSSDRVEEKPSTPSRQKSLVEFYEMEIAPWSQNPPLSKPPESRPSANLDAPAVRPIAEHQQQPVSLTKIVQMQDGGQLEFNINFQVRIVPKEEIKRA